MREITDAPLPTFVVANAKDAAREAAAAIASQIAEMPKFVLGCATGSTPIATYERLVRLAREGLSFAGVHGFNLDEYHGLEAGHPAGFEAFMARHLFDAVGLAPDRRHFPRCRDASESPARAAARFEADLAALGGIDVQLLGIGGNGHIAFNEPGSARDSRTRLVELDESTRVANAAHFPTGTAVPTHALTMGIGTIFEARQLIVMAFGSHKAEIVRRSLREPMSTQVPASFLREHRGAVLWLDEAAAAGL